MIGYLAPDGFLAQLQIELEGAVVATHGRLVLTDGPQQSPAWCANVWRDARRLPITSINHAANQLRAMQRNWALYAVTHHRRAALIEARLPTVSAKPLRFGEPLPTAPLGSWTLLDSETLLAAPDCSSAFPNGEARFIEDRTAPPSRAYLKLWEAFTLLGVHPKLGDTCLDLGASPGGWTWVLQSLGAHVIAVDKAPLDPRIAASPGVEVRCESAFSLEPSAIGPVDWLFCDVVCYPVRLLGLVEKFLAAGTVRNFLCTIKFQGATDFAT